MAHGILRALLWFSAVGCGVMAGVYFAFSTFVMRALQRLSPAQGIATMNAINAVIVKSPFMLLFLGTTIASLVLVVAAAMRWRDDGSMVVLAGGTLYVVGMFLCTMFLNVPLNDALAAVDPGSASGAQVWTRYVADWGFRNHLRTISSVGAAALFVYVLSRGGVDP